MFGQSNSPGGSAIFGHAVAASGFPNAVVGFLDGNTGVVAGQFVPAVLAPRAERRPLWWIIGQLGRRLGHRVLPGNLDVEDPAVDDDAVLDALVDGDRVAPLRALTVPIRDAWLLLETPFENGRRTAIYRKSPSRGSIAPFALPIGLLMRIFLLLLAATVLGTLQLLSEVDSPEAERGVPVESLIVPAVAALGSVGAIRLVPLGPAIVPALIAVALLLLGAGLLFSEMRQRL